MTPEDIKNLQVRIERIHTKIVLAMLDLSDRIDEYDDKVSDLYLDGDAAKQSLSALASNLEHTVREPIKDLKQLLRGIE